MGGRGSNSMERLGSVRATGREQAKRYKTLPDGWRPLLSNVTVPFNPPKGYFWASNGLSASNPDREIALVKNTRDMDAAEAIRDSEYDWERGINDSMEVDTNRGRRTVKGVSYTSQIDGGGEAKIVDTGSGVYIRVGRVQIDAPTDRANWVAPHQDVKHALRELKKFLRAYPNVKLERK